MQADAGSPDSQPPVRVVLGADIADADDAGLDDDRVAVIGADDLGELVGTVVAEILAGRRLLVVPTEEAARSARRAALTIDRLRAARQPA